MYTFSQWMLLPFLCNWCCGCWDIVQRLSRHTWLCGPSMWQLLQPVPGKRANMHYAISQQVRNSCTLGNGDKITQWHEAHTSGRSMSSPFISSSFLSSIAIWMGSSATLRLVSRRLRFWLKTAENEEQVHTLMASVNMHSLFTAICTGPTYCCYEESTPLLQILLNCLLHLIEIWQLVAELLLS